MKMNTRFYKAELHKGQEAALVVIATYEIASGSKHRGAEFFQLMTSFDDSGIQIPHDRQASLAEELRKLDEAAAVLPKVGQKEEMSLVGEKLREVYGDEINMQVSPLEV